MAAPAPKSNKWLPWVLGFFLLSGIGSLIGNRSSTDGGSSGSGVSSDVQDSVKSGCHDAIKGELTSPASAHFHDETVGAAVNGGTGYNDVGSVDSQNGFGALLTSTFICNADANGYVSDSPVLIAH